LNDNQKPYAVVIGLDSMNGIQTARLLALHLIPVIAIAKDPKHPCCKTNVCEKILISNTSSEDFIRTLENLGPKLVQKAVLFPCADMNVLLISRNQHKLEKWYHIILPPQSVVEMMMDKVKFYTYAQENNFPIPSTHFLSTRNDAEKATEVLKFPCIIKPPISATQAWEEQSRLKAYIVENKQEFLAVYDHCHALSDILIAQEWINGPITNLYSCNCYFNSDSEPVVTFIARKIRQWPPETGESSLGEECRNDAVLDETIKLFKSVPYRGLGYVEMKRDESSGQHFIMEPNIGRPTGRSPIAEAGGVELVYTMYCDALGWPLPSNLVQKYGDAKWVSLRRDFQSAFYYWKRGKLTLRDWWYSLRGKKAHDLFSWTDPWPFWGDLIRAFRLYLMPSERRKRDYNNPLS
jgi:predicted ATP-grasp superfamily ATP-dependent carboligase